MTENTPSFRLLFNRVYFSEYNPVRKAAQDFGVSLWTINRWHSGKTKPPLSVLKMLVIMQRGYLPDDPRWKFFKIDIGRGVMITPLGREFLPCELEAFAYHMDRYHTLERLFGSQVSLDDTIQREGISQVSGSKSGPHSTQKYPSRKRTYNKIIYGNSKNFADFEEERARYMHAHPKPFDILALHTCANEFPRFA